MRRLGGGGGVPPPPSNASLGMSSCPPKKPLPAYAHAVPDVGTTWACVALVSLLTGPCTVTRSPRRRVRRAIVICPAVRVASFVCAWGPVLGLLRLRPVPRGVSCIVFLTGPWTGTIVTRMTCVRASWLTGPWGLVRFASVACEWGPSSPLGPVKPSVQLSGPHKVAYRGIRRVGTRESAMQTGPFPTSNPPPL